MSLMPCRWAIRAVILNDMDMLKEAIQNIEEVYSVSYKMIPTKSLIEHNSVHR